RFRRRTETTASLSPQAGRPARATCSTALARSRRSGSTSRRRSVWGCRLRSGRTRSTWSETHSLDIPGLRHGQTCPARSSPPRQTPSRTASARRPRRSARSTAAIGSRWPAAASSVRVAASTFADMVLRSTGSRRHLLWKPLIKGARWKVPVDLLAQRGKVRGYCNARHGSLPCRRLRGRARQWLRGAVVALVTVLALSASTGVASAATFAVTSTADSGPGSLRQAIVDANANTGADTISFALPGSDVQTITATSGPLPAVTDPVVLDARTQPGYTDFPLVQLDNGGGKWTGLKIETGQSRVFGLEVTRFTVGIRLAGDGNTVAACFIGTDGGSTAGLGNTAGVRIESGSGNTVGGTTADMLNLISANGTGVDVVGVSAKKTKVAGNFVGTDRAGSAARPNTIGIRVSAGSTGNVVGGAGSAGARNLISGNTTGVDITGSTTTGNTVVGNFLGTNFGGGGGVPNGEGVLVEGGASGNTIGGFDTAARNVISGNSVAGVHIAGAGTTGNRVFRNLVGTDAGGSARLANRQGVVVSGGATGNTIGDATPGGRPVVSGNVEAGIEITGSGTSGNAVRGAYVGTNAAGNAALGNGTGVRIEAGASGNTVGGTAAGARNLISGNTNGTGVDLRGSGTTGNVVAGNYIGTDAAGGAALANTWGVRIEAGASGNTVGGSTAGARNLISGNGSNSRIDGAGVTINGAGTTGDTVA